MKNENVAELNQVESIIDEGPSQNGLSDRDDNSTTIEPTGQTNSPNQTNQTDQTESQLQNDDEVSNETESSFEESMEVMGFEEYFDDEDEAELLDAIYGSYTDEEMGTPSINESSDSQEVVIGRDQRRKITATNKYPWRAICALKITTKTGRRYIGTGWFIGQRTVITAGHCVYMHNQGGWARSIEVIPGKNGNSNPYGSVKATSFRTVKGWINGRKRKCDYGAIILPKSSKIGRRVGSFGLACKSKSYLSKSVLNLSGYPSDKGGNTQWFMAQRTKRVTSRMIYYNIDTYGGQSGSPVWIMKNNKRYVVGIHTYGNQSGNSATRIVRPVFNNILRWKNS